MYRFRTMPAFCLALLVLPVAFAQNADSGSRALDDLIGKAGIQVLSKGERNGRISWVLSSAEFPRIGFDASGTVDAAKVQTALRLLDAISGWKSLKPSSILLSVESDDVRLRVLPASFSWEGRDLVPVVPSGLTFVAVGSSAAYDFRMKIGSYFLRMQGRFSGELALLERMSRAIANPEAFVRESDPEYAVRRVVEFEEALAAALEAAAALDVRSKALEDLAATLSARSSALETRSRALEERAEASESRAAALEARSSELDARLAETDARLAETDARLAETDARLAETGARLAETDARLAETKTRLSETDARLAAEAASGARTLAVAAALMTKGAFGSAKPVPPEVFAGVEKLRTASPAAASKELVASLKLEGIVATEKQVKAVLALLYGEL